MLNHITLMGRLTDNPDLRSVGSGISTVSFTIAVNRDFKNKETGNYEADFIDIQAWRHTAEFVSKYFTKGQLVAVEGRLQIESYTDREGVKRRAARVVASQVHFAEGRRDSESGQTNYATGFTPPPANENNFAPAPSNYTPPASAGGYSTPSAGGANPYQTPSNSDQFRTVVGPESEEDLPF